MWLLLVSTVALTSQYLHAQPLQQATIGQNAGRGAPAGMHLSCDGTGRPLVILEAGAGRGAADWAKVQPSIGDLTQVCSYDRATGHCCDDVVSDLHRLLQDASLAGPYVLGNSMGGLYARRFINRFPDDSVGLVLVDSADEKELSGIIAPGLQPELYRPGAMSDSELQEFFMDLGRRMMAQRPAPAAGNTTGAKICQ